MSGGRQNGWIVWAGGECPVDPDAMVEVEFRDGEKWLGLNGLACPASDFVGITDPQTSDNNNWMHNGGGFDIIAYRLVQS